MELFYDAETNYSFELTLVVVAAQPLSDMRKSSLLNLY